MLSRILGLIRDVVLMGVFGAGGLMDAFLVAFKIPNFLRRLFAEGAFSQAFVPVLSEYKTNHRLDEVKTLISCTLGALLMILSTLTVAVIALSPYVITLFAPGFDEHTKSVASSLLIFTFPYLLFVSITAFLGSILQSYGHFAMPAFAPVLLNVVMILSALFVAPFFSPAIMALGYAVAIAGLLQMLIQLPQLYQQNLLSIPTINFNHAGVRRILALMLPAVFGVSVTQINLLLNTVLASLMIGGSVSWLYAAERLSELPLGLIGVAIGTVILPSLSSSIAKQDSDNFKKTLDWAARLILLIGLPASVAMFVLADVLMITLFERGEFSHHDALMSALALKSLSGGILGFMLIKIFAPAFFARQDTKTPVKIGIIAVIANMIFSVALVGIFHLANIALHAALALATTLASFVNALLLYYHLHKANIWRFDGRWLKRFAQFGTATAIMTLFLWGILPFFPYQGSEIIRIIALVGFCVLGAIVYGVSLLIMGFRPHELKH